MQSKIGIAFAAIAMMAVYAVDSDSFDPLIPKMFDPLIPEV